MNVEWRRKTEQSAASSSKHQWMGGEVEEKEERKEGEGEEQRARKVPHGVMKSLRLLPKSQ